MTNAMTQESPRHIHRFVTRPSLATIRAIVAPVNVLIALLTAFAAWGGTIDPAVCVIGAIMAMTLPVMLILCVVMLVLDLVFWRKAALVIVASWICSAPPLLAFSPLNLPMRPLTDEEKERSFTFLTYNVLNLNDFRGQDSTRVSNATLDYILDTDADIVSLQECGAISEWPLWNITPEQIRTLRERYPYRLIDSYEVGTILSKYPFVQFNEPTPPEYHKKFLFVRINVKGHIVRLADCHLQSIGLTDEDKSYYRSVLHSKPRNEDQLREEVTQVKTRLISKLQDAFIHRRDQAILLRNMVDSLPGNWIVAGDFNDIPDCYAVRTIMGKDMHDAYADCAFGPRITYHDKMFYFRIDQVLYGGDMHAVSIRRDRNPSSDHYPLLTTFVFDE